MRSPRPRSATGRRARGRRRGAGHAALADEPDRGGVEWAGAARRRGAADSPDGGFNRAYRWMFHWLKVPSRTPPGGPGSLISRGRSGPQLVPMMTRTSGRAPGAVDDSAAAESFSQRGRGPRPSRCGTHRVAPCGHSVGCTQARAAIGTPFTRKRPYLRPCSDSWVTTPTEGQHEIREDRGVVPSGSVLCRQLAGPAAWGVPRKLRAGSLWQNVA